MGGIWASGFLFPFGIAGSIQPRTDVPGHKSTHSAARRSWMTYTHTKNKKKINFNEILSATNLAQSILMADSLDLIDLWPKKGTFSAGRSRLRTAKSDVGRPSLSVLRWQRQLNHTASRHAMEPHHISISKRPNKKKTACICGSQDVKAAQVRICPSTCWKSRTKLAPLESSALHISFTLLLITDSFEMSRASIRWAVVVCTTRMDKILPALAGLLWILIIGYYI